MPESPFKPTGLGVDIVHVPRIEQHLNDDRFLRRLFSDRELGEVGTGPSRAKRLAGHWAAKEAFAKALGCGFGESLTWADVEVEHNDNGAPALFLSERTLNEHGPLSTLLSISHDGDYAIAVVWITR